MNKNQLTMAITGGAAVLATLVMAYFINSTGATREDAIGDLETQKGIFNQNRNASRDEEKAVRANVSALRDWMSAATDLAASVTGAMAKVDMDLSASVFKSRMLDDVRRYQKLPADTKIKFVAAGDAPIDQTFPDFKDYIIRNSMPEAPELRRRWAEICLVLDTLVQCGAESLVSVKVDTPAPVREDPAARRVSAPSPAPSFKVDAEKYTFVFLARQDALVRALNALATVDRFISVDALSFVQEPDPLVAVLGGSSKDKDEKAGRHGGRRRRGAASEPESMTEEEKAAEKLRSGTVTNPADPLAYTPFKVTMSLSTLAVGGGSGKEDAK